MIGSQWSLGDIQPQRQYEQGEGIKRRPGETNAAADLNKSSHKRQHDGSCNFFKVQFNLSKNFAISHVTYL